MRRDVGRQDRHAVPSDIPDTTAVVSQTRPSSFSRVLHGIWMMQTL
ncbi:hypothetical protein [Roseospira marina]|nr:hypothetical protein [Roseospira marina]MBB5088582.1 hypothetical protein [Roseospira marina]